MKLNEHLTKSEQKVLFFLLIMGFIGLTVKLVENQRYDDLDNEQWKEELQVEYHIQYDINTVTEQELITIPRIGNVKARAIIEYRDEYKPIVFNDLINVKGIGEKTLEQMREYFNADND